MLGKVIEKILQYFVGCFFMILMLITAVDVFGRYVLNLPLRGSTELTEIFLGLIIFSVLPIVCKNNEHIRVDLIEEKIPIRIKQIREVVIQLLLFAGLLFMGWGIYRYGQRINEDGITTEILRFQIGYFYYLLALLILLSLLMVLGTLMSSLKSIFRPINQKF